ncbi:KR domain-containing protein, partial [Streptomyces sp. A73]|nr:KR domain-containing protein [Streptomyces sp. A73]
AGDAEAVARLVAEAGADRPLTGVVHAAGVLDDAVLLSQSGDRVDGSGVGPGRAGREDQVGDGGSVRDRLP